ncbi:LAQU0S04e00540g1_1 [Lachancea quebecensis]|uniref:Decapping nuclease n=1 Tax=Lachancea quebecensis TaxID=1654605 RepID=A0A0P1KQ51_9SACH|nr:LAQU0S04e00540g1_1 [Lachancea quebecensis]
MKVLRTYPYVKATFSFEENVDASGDAHLRAQKCAKFYNLSAYNDLHRSFDFYMDSNNQRPLPMLCRPGESNDFGVRIIPVSQPRLTRLNLAVSQLNYMPKKADVFTNRGDLVDIALSFFPHFHNNFQKIRHVAHIKHGRLFLWHDAQRDDTFSSSNSRDGWYSGYKFEDMCRHSWPEDHQTWTALPETRKDNAPLISLVELPLKSDVNTVMMAEYDLRLPGARKPSGFVELKCFLPQVDNPDSVPWQDLTTAEALDLLVNKRSFMKFFKTCLQSRFSGCEHLVYGIRNKKVKLVGVRKFYISEVEQKLQELEPRLFFKHYITALTSVGEFVDFLFRECKEGEFYLITKKSVHSPLSVVRTPKQELMFQTAFTPDFESLLTKHEKQRNNFLKKSRPNFSAPHIDGYKDVLEYRPLSLARKGGASSLTGAFKNHKPKAPVDDEQVDKLASALQNTNLQDSPSSDPGSQSLQNSDAELSASATKSREPQKTVAEY